MGEHVILKGGPQVGYKISDLHPSPLGNFWFAPSAPTYHHCGGCWFVATPWPISAIPRLLYLLISRTYLCVLCIHVLRFIIDDPQLQLVTSSLLPHTNDPSLDKRQAKKAALEYILSVPASKVVLNDSGDDILHVVVTRTTLFGRVYSQHLNSIPYKKEIAKSRPGGAKAKGRKTDGTEICVPKSTTRPSFATKDGMYYRWINVITSQTGQIRYMATKNACDASMMDQGSAHPRHPKQEDLGDRAVPFGNSQKPQIACLRLLSVEPGKETGDFINDIDPDSL
eukprot:scaffold432_cov69-Cyclotella_meneghiniana.AAC.24